MNRSIKILFGALTIQVALYALLTYRDMSSTTTAKQEPLLTVDFDKVDKVLVENSDKKTLQLQKKDAKWILPTFYNFPIAEEKVTQVLKYLAEVKRSYALGNTKAAAKQYETTDDKFERKITYYVGDKLESTLYLGNSPTYRKVYARVDNDDKTFAIEFNTVDAPTEAKDWAERNIYKLDKDKLAEVKFQDFTLKKEGASFILEGLKEEEVTNTTEMENFLSKLQNPLFEDVLEGQGYDSAHKLLEYSVTNQDKSERKFAFFEIKSEAKLAPASKKTDEFVPTEPAQGEFAALKVSDLPYFFKVRRARVDELLKFNHASLAKKKEADKKSESDMSKEAGQVGVPAGGPG